MPLIFVTVHQTPPTAKGHPFITLEDEFGFINVVVRPDIYARYRKVWRETTLLVVDGQVQKQGQVTNRGDRRDVSLTRALQLRRMSACYSAKLRGDQ